MSFKKLPNLELILYMTKMELAVHHDSWQAIIDEKKAKNRFIRPDFAVQVFPQMWGNTCTGFYITRDGFDRELHTRHLSGRGADYSNPIN